MTYAILMMVLFACGDKEEDTSSTEEVSEETAEDTSAQEEESEESTEESE